MRKILASLLLSVSTLAADAAGNGLTAYPILRADQTAFRETYKELVETDTSPATGDCTLAATRMAARLKAAGYPDTDLNVFVEPRFPRDGGLVATLHGNDPGAGALTLLAHIDVVNVNRAEWKRPPFQLGEDATYFYGRGTTDDKAMAAVWIDTLVRLRTEHFHPRRTIHVALTCGEESGGRFRGAQWLATQHKDWIDAAFALNEGAGGELDEQGNRVSLAIQAGEKTYQDYTLTTTDVGGHSARPHKENPLTRMAAALTRIGAYDFPVMFTDSTRIFFQKTALQRGGEIGAAMTRLLNDPGDAKADAQVSADPDWHSMLRTTCVATMIKGGEERSALPEHIEVNVNCRIFPGISPDAVLKILQDVVADPKVTIALRAASSTGEVTHIAPPPPPLNARILEPVRTMAAKLYPGVPIFPTLSTGATDGRFLIAAGIPTYGLSGMFRDPDGDGVHGVDERMPVRSLYDGRDFLYGVVKLYAAQQ